MVGKAPNVRVGFFFDGDEATPNMAAMLRVEDGETLLEIPLAAGITDPFTRWFRDWQPPPSLIFRDRFGTASLSGLAIRQHDSPCGSGMGRGVIEVAQLVHCGRRAPDFTEVNAVRSEIAGLPRWLEPKVFSFTRSADGKGRTTDVEFRVTSVPAATFPGVPGLSLAPHFRASHQWADGTHSMTETTQVETRFEDSRPWKEHIDVHRTLQDLVAIAFWRPCDLVVKQAMRFDDPTVTGDGDDPGEEWRDAVVPDAGRGPASGTLRPVATDRRPLFTFGDIGAAGVERWFAEYDQLGQAMWVLASSLFRTGGTVEVELLQIGTALEALGYELAARTGRVTRGRKDRSFTLVESLTLVCDSTDCNLDEVLNGDSARDWATAFNRVYKGVKHADNPLPDPNEAYQRARQGALLARLWLARHLGADRATVEERLPLHIR